MTTLLRFSLCALSLVTAAAAKDYVVTIAAPAEERVAQVVTITLPADAPATAVLAAVPGGELTALQRADDRTARFVVPKQRAGERLQFILQPAGGAQVSGVVAKEQPGRLSITAADRPALAYRTDKEELPRAGIDPKYKRAGYIHPLLSPAGHIVTGDYPANHIHHHGIWSPWTKTKFQGRAPDFWNMQDRTGTVEFDRIGRTWNGSVDGGFVAQHRMIDLSAPSPVTALNETWEVTFYAVRETPRPLHVLDFVITQTCATADALVLPQYHYGGLGFRGPDAWDGKPNLTVLTSEGVIDRIKANDTRVRWIFAGGKVDGGAEAGVVVLGHPGNFRAPQPVRVHPNMPYWSLTPSQLGDWSIEPGKPYVARYRFIALDGAPDAALFEAAWLGYAQPAVATLAAQ